MDDQEMDKFERQFEILNSDFCGEVRMIRDEFFINRIDLDNHQSFCIGKETSKQKCDSKDGNVEKILNINLCRITKNFRILPLCTLNNKNTRQKKSNDNEQTVMMQNAGPVVIGFMRDEQMTQMPKKLLHSIKYNIL